ncbi:zinc-finger domain-containing protein [Legionella anisa]|uniref:zinc-finger domain-containing protein n=1 Tax=Legionella anisa TaxID=28082 RepID=UPI0009DB1048
MRFKGTSCQKPKKRTSEYKKNYVVHPNELPLSCPTKDMVLWNAHPKVYLPIEKTGVEVCPYCGSRFVLQND